MKTPLTGPHTSSSELPARSSLDGKMLKLGIDLIKQFLYNYNIFNNDTDSSRIFFTNN